MYLTAKDLANELKVAIPTLYRLIKSGELPEGRKFGKSRRWDSDVIKDWFNRKEQN